MSDIARDIQSMEDSRPTICSTCGINDETNVLTMIPINNGDILCDECIAKEVTSLRADLAHKDELIEALRGVNVAYEKLRLKFVGIVIGMTEALEAAELEAEGLEAALGRLSELTDALVAARTRLAEVEGSCKPTVDDCPAHQPKAHDPA